MRKLIYILILGIFTQCSLDEVNYLDDCGVVVSSVSRTSKYGSGYKGYETTIKFYNCYKECYNIIITKDKVELGTEICNTF